MCEKIAKILEEDSRVSGVLQGLQGLQEDVYMTCRAAVLAVV
jgi:hypothetical protein